MPVKKYNPTSPGTRFMTVSTFEEITKKEPEKSLWHPSKRLAAETRTEELRFATTEGSKKKYRIIDFKRDKDGIKAKVAAIEYDRTEQLI